MFSNYHKVERVLHKPPLTTTSILSQTFYCGCFMTYLPTPLAPINPFELFWCILKQIANICTLPSKCVRTRVIKQNSSAGFELTCSVPQSCPVTVLVQESGWVGVGATHPAAPCQPAVLLRKGTRLQPSDILNKYNFFGNGVGRKLLGSL